MSTSESTDIARSTSSSTVKGPMHLGQGPETKRPTMRGVIAGSWWWALPAGLLVFFVMYVSIGAGSIYAFTNWDGFSTPIFVGIQNFISIFQSATTRTALLNTLVVAAAFVILTNIFGLLFALALNRQLKSRHALRVILFAPVVLSPLAVSYIWQFIFQYQGPLNQFLASVGLHSWQQAWLGNDHYALIAVIIVMVWQNMGLVMVIYLAGLANVPAEIEEAAAIDGAGVWKRFRYITLWQIQPSITIAVVLMLIQGLKVFDQVIGLTGGGPDGATETLATQVWRQTFVNGQFGYGAALSLILTVIVIVFALLQVLALRRRESK